MEKFAVEFYQTDDGKYPAEEFLRSLDTKMMVKMYGLIGILEERGNMLREPYSKHIEDGIFELRAKVGTDISRVLYFFYSGKKIILTNGFIKKTQKTPKQEILKAKEFRNNYLGKVVD